MFEPQPLPSQHMQLLETETAIYDAVTRYAEFVPITGGINIDLTIVRFEKANRKEPNA